MTGGHWLALQSFAWLRMAVEYSQEDGLRAGLWKTFSGRYPCSMCVKVQQGWHHQQQQEKERPWLQNDTVTEAVWEWRALTAPPAPMFGAGEGGFASVFYFEFTDSPPTPPPRA